MIPPSSPSASGDGAVSRYLLWPTTISSPASMRRIRSRWESTSEDFMYATASTAPPCSATIAISAFAPSTSSATSPSITTEPSKMSGYSSRSVSKARICWMRSDHC